jgi:hypothetical protein
MKKLGTDLFQVATVDGIDIVTGVRGDNVGWGNMEYYLCNLNNCTRVEDRIK